MPTFQITGPDGKQYRVSGESANGALAALQQHLGSVQQEPDPRDSFFGRVDTAVRGAADTLSLGFADEIAAGLGTGFGYLGDYNAELARQRGIDSADVDERGGYRLAGQLAGAVTGGAGLAKNGLSMAANAAGRGASLGRVAAASAGEGAILGGLQGFGSGEGATGRAASAGVGAAAGLALGGAIPLAVSGVQNVAGMAAAPVMARIFPENYSQRALGEVARRAGMTPEDIYAALAQSQADDQAMFTAADALGHSGQRMLSTVARNPNDARQGVIEALESRQIGQGDRLASFIAEGFDATDTAAQRAAALTKSRDAASDAAFSAVRREAGPVDVSNVIDNIDQTLRPGVSTLMNPGNDIAYDTVENALSRARAMITDGRSNMTDFNALYRARQDIADWVKVAERAGRGNQARLLRDVRNELDRSLTKASSRYRDAMLGHEKGSRVIDAVDIGVNSASGRMRAADTVPRFSAMTPDEQSAFRAGYADPLIARIESAAMSPSTNKARALITPKTAEEFPAFAATGRATQLQNRIAREQRMFQTANAALGGSKTADNLADAAEMAKFDPGIMSKLLRGDVPGAIMDGIRRGMAEASGAPPRVIEQVSKALMETNPEAAREAFRGGAAKLTRSQQARARVIAAMITSGTAGTGRLAP